MFYILVNYPRSYYTFNYDSNQYPRIDTVPGGKFFFCSGVNPGRHDPIDKILEISVLHPTMVIRVNGVALPYIVDQILEIFLDQNNRLLVDVSISPLGDMHQYVS